MGDYSKVYLQHRYNRNQRWNMYFVYGEDGKFYDPDDYYKRQSRVYNDIIPYSERFSCSIRRFQKTIT